MGVQARADWTIADLGRAVVRSIGIGGPIESTKALRAHLKSTAHQCGSASDGTGVPVR